MLGSPAGRVGLVRAMGPIIGPYDNLAEIRGAIFSPLELGRDPPVGRGKAPQVPWQNGGFETLAFEHTFEQGLSWCKGEAMLIQLGSRFVIDPVQYASRLVVELDIGGGFGEGAHSECGVFSGKHDGFEHSEEMNQRLEGFPIEGNDWLWRYEIRAPNRSQPSRCWRYHYVAIGWYSGVYMEYPQPTEIVLEDSAGSWSVSIGQVNGLTLLLPDYAPWNTVPGDWIISEPGKPLREGSTLDSTPLPTDWEDIHELWEDMKKFSDEHPNHTFILADDPGFNRKPVRVPRLGWSAYLKVGLGGDEQAKEWTITLSDVRKTFRGREDLIPTSANRHTQLQELNKPGGSDGSY